MNEFVLEAKLHALFYKWPVQSSGVWITVLLLHLFLWNALNNGRDMPPPRQRKSAYLLVTPITLIDSAHAPQIVKDSLKTIKKISKISSKAIQKEQRMGAETRVQEKKIVIPTVRIDQKRLNELSSVEKTSELQEPSFSSDHDASPKRTKELDFDEMKRAALAVTREPPKRLLPGADKKISKAQKFSDAIDHAKRGDCRSEHAHLGILAIPFLLKDTITGEGCKW